MRASTTSSRFPDINVWVALTHANHVHHTVARDWFDSLEDGAHFCFCRFTQLGLLRLLTAEVVMGDEVLTQSAAWRVYDQWLRDDRVTFVDEPPNVERRFRALSRLTQAAPKAWADAYIAAFADTAAMTLVTFDRAFHGKVASIELLSE